MREKGDHTWDIFIRYHACPNCGNIMEDRHDYVYDKVTKSYIKHLECPRCKHKFTLTKKRRSSWWPLFGTPQPPGIEWSEEESKKNR